MIDDRARQEFRWNGHDERDQPSGRGSAALQADGLHDGPIYFHVGRDSAFRAEQE